MSDEEMETKTISKQNGKTKKQQKKNKKVQKSKLPEPSNDEEEDSDVSLAIFFNL